MEPKPGSASVAMPIAKSTGSNLAGTEARRGVSRCMEHLNAANGRVAWQRPVAPQCPSAARLHHKSSVMVTRSDGVCFHGVRRECNGLTTMLMRRSIEPLRDHISTT